GGAGEGKQEDAAASQGSGVDRSTGAADAGAAPLITVPRGPPSAPATAAARRTPRRVGRPGAAGGPEEEEEASGDGEEEVNGSAMT
ncbi:hypothetical protein AB0C60_33140, partial [Streptomyces sp. NPDC048845]